MPPNTTLDIQTPVELPATVDAPTPPPSPTPVRWPPAALKPLGTLAGEGAWSPYIQEASGNTAAVRAYLQPDPQRPYAVVAVIAFDLLHTRLHFVLGSVEPFSPDAPPRSGKIPAADLAPGRLLATFNGGFKATHGKFGAMADGVTVLPPRDGVGTLAIFNTNRDTAFVGFKPVTYLNKLFCPVPVASAVGAASGLGGAPKYCRNHAPGILELA